MFCGRLVDKKTIVLLFLFYDVNYLPSIFLLHLKLCANTLIFSIGHAYLQALL